MHTISKGITKEPLLDPPHKPPGDGIVSIRERRGNDDLAPPPPQRRVRRNGKAHPGGRVRRGEVPHAPARSGHK